MADTVIGGITGSDFTIEIPFTLGTSPVAGGTLFIRGTDADFDYRVFLDPDNNALRFQLYEDDNSTLRTVTLPDLANIGVAADDTWHYLHIRMDYSGVNGAVVFSLRIDNVDYAQGVVSAWSGAWKYSPTNKIVIGNDAVGGSNPWAGRVDDWSFYNRALTDNERDEVYNWWSSNASATVYGDITTVAYNDNFGLAQSVTSYRGYSQFRLNFRTSDNAYPGLTGDYAVGVPAPVKTPLVSVDVEGDPTAIETDTRFYLMTYVNRLGYESAPGPVTEAPTYVGEATNVSINFPLFQDIAYEASAYDDNTLQDFVPIVAARFYRTNTGTSETGFQYIAEQRLVSEPATFEDVENDDLGELLITDNWDVPPPEVTTGCKMANGTYVLAHEYRIHFSVPGVTYAFPILYNRVLRHRALHLEAIGTSAVLLTDGGPHLVAGASGDTMEVVPLPFYHVPTSVRGISTYLDLVIFPAQDGLIGIDANGRVTNLTEDIFEEDQWRCEVDIDAIISEVYDSVYYGFYYNNSETGTRGFSLNLKTREWSWLDNNVLGTNIVAGMHYDRTTDSFYIADSDSTPLVEWQPHITGFVYTPGTEVYGDLLETVINSHTPYHYWPMDETSGATLVDSVGNFNLTIDDGTMLSENSSRADGAGTAFTSTGNDSNSVIYQLTGAESLMNLTQDFTLAFAMKNNTDPFGFYTSYIVDKYQSGGSLSEYHLYIQENGGFHELWFPIYQSNGTLRNQLLVANLENEGWATDGAWRWFSIKMDYSGAGLLTVKMNNVEIASINVSGWSGTWRNNTNARFGSRFESVNGGLDEMAFFQSALTAQQETDQYTAWAYDGLPISSTTSFFTDKCLAGQGSADPILDAVPTSYWKFDETSGLVFSDEMGNSDATLQNDGFGSAPIDVSASSDLPLRTEGNSFSARGATNLGEDAELLVLAEGGAHDDIGRVWESETDWTFFGLATVDVDPTTVLNVGESMMFMSHGSPDGFIMSLRFDNDTGGLVLRWREVTDNNNVTIVPNFMSNITIGETFCWRFQGSTTSSFVKFFIGNTEFSIDVSGYTNWQSNDGRWLFDGALSFSNFGPMLGSTAGDTFTAHNWLGRFDDVAYFNRIIGDTEAGTFCVGGTPTPTVSPVPWEWYTKEFIIPNRSYGAVKIMGELDVNNSLEVTLELDGVDQALFPIHVGQANGICVSEEVFRLPAVRAQRMRLKMKTSTGAPVVESVQISVHPMELV